MQKNFPPSDQASQQTVSNRQSRTGADRRVNSLKEEEHDRTSTMEIYSSRTSELRVPEPRLLCTPRTGQAGWINCACVVTTFRSARFDNLTKHGRSHSHPHFSSLTSKLRDVTYTPYADSTQKFLRYTGIYGLPPLNVVKKNIVRIAV